MMDDKKKQLMYSELIDLVNSLKNDGHVTENQRRKLNSCIKTAYLYQKHNLSTVLLNRANGSKEGGYAE